MFRCEGARNREGDQQFLVSFGRFKGDNSRKEFYTVFLGYACLVKYESILRDGRFFIVGDIIDGLANVTLERLSLEGYDFQRCAQGDGNF